MSLGIVLHYSKSFVLAIGLAQQQKIIKIKGEPEPCKCVPIALISMGLIGPYQHKEWMQIKCTANTGLALYSSFDCWAWEHHQMLQGSSLVCIPLIRSLTRSLISWIITILVLSRLHQVCTFACYTSCAAGKITARVSITGTDYCKRK